MVASYEITQMLTVYGVFLACTGWFGAMAHDFRPDVMHSLYAGGGSGAIMVVLGLMCRGEPARGEPGFLVFMVGVHLALVLTLLFAVVFFVQFARNWYKILQRNLFCVMGGASLLIFIALVKAKKKSKKPSMD